MSIGAKWLSNEDARCFEDRLSRIEWLVDNSPAGENWTFPGGLLAKSLFEEARYCFVYAQTFLATILLGLAYIERTLAALSYEAGRNDLERAPLSVLLEEAHAEGLIGSSEFRLTWREFAKTGILTLTFVGQGMSMAWKLGRFLNMQHPTMSSKRTRLQSSQRYSS